MPPVHCQRTATSFCARCVAGLPSALNEREYARDPWWTDDVHAMKAEVRTRNQRNQAP